MGADTPATVRQVETVQKNLDGMRKDFDGLKTRVDALVHDLNNVLRTLAPHEQAVRRLEHLDVARLQRMDWNLLGQITADRVRDIAKIGSLEAKLAQLQTIVTRLAGEARH